MDDVSGESPEDVQSPCVRAFVRNFEQRDTSSGGGGSSNAKPPVMPKSKVAQLRANLGKTEPVRRVDSEDDSGGDVLREPEDGGDASEGPECAVSVAKLKESLQRSANDKRVAPWGLGGTGRSVKEPKKPCQNYSSDGEAIEDTTRGEQRPKKKINNSFKIAKTNLLAPFTKTKKPNGNKPVDVAADVADEDSGRCDSAPSKLSLSGGGGGVVVGRSSSTEEVEKPKVVPKVLPKPAVRKSKMLSAKARSVESNCEKKTLERKPESTAEGSDPVPENNSSAGPADSFNGGICRPDAATAEDVISATGTFSDRSNEASDHNSSDEHLILPHDVDEREETTARAEYDRNHRAVTDADNLSEKIYRSRKNDFRRDASEESSHSAATRRPGADGPDAKRGETIENQSRLSVNSADSATVTNEDEIVDDCKRCLSYETTATPSNDDNDAAESRLDDASTGTDPVSFQTESSCRDSDLRAETPPGDESRFLDCMGSDFLTEIKELCSVTIEEIEYDALSEIACSKICAKEDDSARWLLSPLESYRSAVDYVANLFKDEVFTNVAAKKSAAHIIDESSFLSCDSLRETLLDKATKKFERLTHLKQKLGSLFAKHDQLEQELKAVVKKRIDMKYFSKYCSVIEDLDKVTHLLLMLSSRLASTDVALDQFSFSENKGQKDLLIAKRENLTVKYEEAVLLKESIETRRRRVTEHLEQRLRALEFSDYQDFVRTKCQLKLVSQSLEDRLALSDEQRRALVDLIERRTSAKYC